MVWTECRRTQSVTDWLCTGLPDTKIKTGILAKPKQSSAPLTAALHTTKAAYLPEDSAGPTLALQDHASPHPAIKLSTIPGKQTPPPTSWLEPGTSYRLSFRGRYSGTCWLPSEPFSYSISALWEKIAKLVLPRIGYELQGLLVWALCCPEQARILSNLSSPWNNVDHVLALYPDNTGLQAAWLFLSRCTVK